MKKFFLLAVAALAGCVCANAEVASTLFLIGEPAGGWSTSKGIEMTKTSDGVFETDVTFQGKNSFGFVKALNSSDDWTAFNSCRYTPAAAGTVPVEGENDMEYTGDTTDYSWDLGAGSYHFTVNTNTMKFIVSLQGEAPKPVATQYYFVGEVNSWNFLDDYILSSEGNEHTFTAPVIRAGVEFKLSARDWNPAYTTENKFMTSGETYPVVYGDNLPNMAFAYDIEDAVLVLDTEAATLTVKGTAGIDGVTVGSENGTPEYFTLQGVKVAAPEAGIYIVRCGSRVSKVYVK